MNASPASVSSIHSDSEQPPKKESAKAHEVLGVPAAAAAATKVAAKLIGHKTKPPNRSTQQSLSKPTKSLPSERITFSRQLDILRGWAAASGPLRKAVSNNEVAKIVDMQPTTVSMLNAFFASTGLLVKTEGGYVPAEEVTG